MLDTMKNCENELATSDGPLHPMPIGEAKIPDDGSGNDSCSTMAWLFCAVLALVYLEQASAPFLIASVSPDSGFVCRRLCLGCEASVARWKDP